MKTLSPTLWRTCRMLSGQTRIRLLRHLHDHPGHHVSELARMLGIGVSDASQELRRIQSRGLLQADYHGARLIYRLGADPLVYSADPVLKALRTALASSPPADDERLQWIAKGLGHRKRIALVELLGKGPRTAIVLQQEMQTPFCGISPHLRILRESGFIRREGQVYHLAAPSHPLARTLLKLLFKH